MPELLREEAEVWIIYHNVPCSFPDVDVMGIRKEFTIKFWENKIFVANSFEINVETCMFWLLEGI